MKSIIISLLLSMILTFITISIPASMNTTLIVIHLNEPVLAAPNGYSIQVGNLNLADKVTLINKKGDWLLITASNQQIRGYIHLSSLFNITTYKRATKFDEINLKSSSSFDSNNYKSIDDNSSKNNHQSYDFDYPSAVKRFIGSDEVNNTFDELPFASKGFSEEVDDENVYTVYEKMNNWLAYRILDIIDKHHHIENRYQKLLKFRMKGGLGEYSVYHQKAPTNFHEK